MGQKRVFLKVIVDHLGCLNKCFLARFEPAVNVLTHGKSQNALKRGRFGAKKGSKMGQKRVFPRVIVDHLGCLNKCFLARFEPAVTLFGPWKIPKCLEKGPFWDQKKGQKWVKNTFL